MGFSNEWEKRYSNNTHLSVWPWSDVVSLVHRHCKNFINAEDIKVLEFGCGAGANIPLFLSLGMKYFAVEGSATIVKQLHDRYPDLREQISVGDFTVEQPYGNGFKLLIDRASITHNNTESIKSALQIAYDALLPGGIYIGTDWFSTNHTCFNDGKATDDLLTRSDYINGQFAGVGKVHFSDEQHLKELFSNFEIIFMEEKQSRLCEPQENHLFASFNIVGRKPYV